MSDIIYIRKINESTSVVDAPGWVLQEISDHFSFKLPSARFHPAFKAKAWDGIIRLFNPFDRRISNGLIPSLVKYADSNAITVEADHTIADEEVSFVDIDEFIEKLKRKNLYPSFEIAEDQKKAIAQCFRKKRLSLLSPTASGKSFIIYLNCWWWKRKTLILVDSVNLATQMRSDLISYGMPEEFIHVVTAGATKDPPLKVKLTLADGSIHHLLGNQSIKTLNRGKVIAADLREGDEVDELQIFG